MPEKTEPKPVPVGTCQSCRLPLFENHEHCKKSVVPVVRLLVRSHPSKGEAEVKALILKEFEIAETVQCEPPHSPAPHTAYILDNGDGTTFKVCSLDAVARPETIDVAAVAVADATAEPTVPGVAP